MGLQMGCNKYCCLLCEWDKDFALPEERQASEENSEDQREKCATPSTGRMAQNAATAPKYQTQSDEKLRKSHGPDWIGVQVSG